MHNNIEIIREFIDSWSSLDASVLAEFFTEDGTYFNVPTQPVKGKKNIERFIQRFIANWTQTQWDILNIVCQGDVVFCERLDRTKSTAGDVDLPCLGVFEMHDGRIHIWRDYFDMNTFVKAMS